MAGGMAIPKNVAVEDSKEVRKALAEPVTLLENKEVTGTGGEQESRLVTIAVRKACKSWQTGKYKRPNT